MKRYLYFLLLMASVVQAQTLSIPDVQFKAYLLSSTDTNNIALNASFSSIKIDANSNGEIEVSEAAQVRRLWIEESTISDLSGIEGFANLQQLTVKGTSVSSIALNIPTLFRLQCNENHALTAINMSGSTGLSELICPDNALLASMNVSGCEEITQLVVRNNSLMSLDASGLENIITLDVSQSALQMLNVSGCTALTYLNLAQTNLTNINVSGLTNLVGLAVNNTASLTTINASGCSSLTSFTFSGCENIATLDLSNCTSLNSLSMTSNLSSLNVTGCSGMSALMVQFNNLTSLDLTGCTSLVTLYCFGNPITDLDVSTCPALVNLQAYDCQLETIIFSNPLLSQADLSNNQLIMLVLVNHTNLTTLDISENPVLSMVNLSGCISLQTLNVELSLMISFLDVSDCISLNTLFLTSEALSGVNVSGCTGLESLVISGTSPNLAPITSIDASNLPSLSSFACYYSQLSAVNLDNTPQLVNLILHRTQFSQIDLSGHPGLTSVTIAYNPIVTVDLSAQSQLLNAHLENNNLLTHIFAKNGASESIAVNTTNPNLVFICQDEDAVEQTRNFITSLGLTGVNVNSYCSFVPGGDYNTITGIIQFDHDGNGCDTNDWVRPHVKVTMDDGSQIGSTFTNPDGSYTFFTNTGDFQWWADVENPAYFTISPATATTSFPDLNNNVYTQNFCLSALGVHPDVEVVIAPLSGARPGFGAFYQLTVRNKGNQTVSGNFTLAYQEELMDFMSATVLVPTLVSEGLLSWDYVNLRPFETMTSYLIFTINSPVDTPPVNQDDILTFIATVNPTVGDESPEDNVMVFMQTVVNSYDPNDITCIEGESVDPSNIGKYLHYIVNFENLGTAEAENVVVRIQVDPELYDVGSLQIIETSHVSYSRVTGNTIEFIFENVDLEAAQGNPPVGGHGNVLFKIKSNSELQVGDSVTKMADIFFDYNFPIQTNDAETIFQSLQNPAFTDNLVSVYPNPSSGIVNVNTESEVLSLELFDVQGRLLQVSHRVKSIDISSRSNGLYFLRIKTDRGTKVEKLVRQ